MSLVTDSPVHSSSSDDFAAFLDDQLDTLSSDSLPDQEDDGEEELESKTQSAKKRKVEVLDNVEESKTSSSQASRGKAIACLHPGSYGSMCIACGQIIEDESGVRLGYIHKNFVLTNGEMDRLRTKDKEKLRRDRKLILILDLDHTLLNSTELRDMTPDEEYLKCQRDALQGSLFILKSIPMITKLRPFVQTFLREANTMFEMYVYTMGDRSYAAEMVKLLDPHDEYFHSRVISRDESTEKHQKGLDLVLGQESTVLILDDTARVWSKHKDNLILMERYNFFASSCRQFGFKCKSLSERKSDESETEGALVNVLKVLKQVHDLFFKDLGDNHFDRDVRQMLKIARKEILKGCKIVFSRLFPTASAAEDQEVWQICELMGASCCADVDSSVTHVVSGDAGTEKARWAVKEKKFLVNLRWIEASNYFWSRQPEENFPVVRNNTLT